MGHRRIQPYPRDHKAQVAIWADLDATQSEAIINAASLEEVRSLLADQFKLTDLDDNSASSILLDLYYYTVQFALNKGFNKEQLSAFFSIVKKTHEVCSETPFGNLEQTYNYFKELVLCHAVKRPPWSINLFSPDQVHQITEYVLNTYFRHYKLYKYVFTPMVRLDLSISYAGMPETPVPSEAGDVEADQPVEEQKEEQPAGEEEKLMEEPPEEETAAQKELRKLITTQLNEEISRLRLSLDEQIQLNDEALQKKLASVDGGGGAKNGRGSSKGKKK
ncbi:coiled-coil domain-containing protein 189-like isoform X2 [Patiria miniata]|uniref:Coiled-coil domain-containing protein 189 n=1 Tax=Patiria miniata TaxID=46514 RepID=A0A914A6L9_PATMI|nr:coiled-coil domain-containing protein 189-like isoform X2 [Patiria miniata]